MTMSLSTVMRMLLAALAMTQVAAFGISQSVSFAKSSLSTTGHSGRSTCLFMSDGDDTPQRGTVKWFDTMKGFGFIVPDAGGSDVFVHQSAIQAEGFRSLADGESVEYKVAVDEGSGRRRAVQVTGPDGANVQGAPFRPEQKDGDWYGDDGY